MNSEYKQLVFMKNPENGYKTIKDRRWCGVGAFIPLNRYKLVFLKNRICAIASYCFWNKNNDHWENYTLQGSKFPRVNP